MDKDKNEKKRATRVLVNALHAKSGGGLTYLRNMLSRLAGDPRLELHLLLSVEQQTVFLPLDDGIAVHPVKAPTGFLGLLFWEQMKVPGFARRIGADVTFSPANYGPLFAPGSVIMLRNGLAVAGNERRPGKLLYWLGLGFMTLACLLTCRRAIAVSEYARRALTFCLPRRMLEKVAVVHHGVDPGFTVEQGTPHEDEPPFLLAVSDIYIQKNFHTLIAAMGRIRNDRPDVVLKIAGKKIDEAYFGRLQKEIDRLGLGEKVEFLGSLNRDTLASLLRSCSVFVFPSTVETFGNPLVEAMASGAPVACSMTAAMPEIVGGAGLYFDPADADDMAETILKILQGPEIRVDLRSRGQERARDFSWDKTARLTADILVDAAPRR